MTRNANTSPAALLRRLDRQDPAFTVLANAPPRPVPLLVVVHPGDLLQVRMGWAADAWKAVSNFETWTLDGLRSELAQAHLQGWDVAVLHRGSCSGLPAHRSLWAHLVRAFATGSVAYGDDLDAAAAWLLATQHLAERPRVRFAGAYADPAYGCITAVAKNLLAQIPNLPLEVAPTSPGGNGPGPVWRPNAPDTPLALPQPIQTLFDAIA